MILVDKGYYDYDFEEPPKKEQELTGQGKSDEEVRDALLKFGFGHLKKEKTDEELQDYILKNGG